MRQSAFLPGLRPRSLKLVVAAASLCIGFGIGASQEQDLKTPLPLPSENSGFSGKVVETTNAATYTYIQVDTGTRKLWAAAPQFAVKVGDSVAVATGMAMPNYHSKTLNRDFDVVYFTSSVTVNGNPPVNSISSMLPQNHPPISGLSGQPKVDLAGIKKAAGGRTIAEIFAGAAELSGKQETVRGKVVKYNAQIMGKNWLHIQDGTGSAGSNDLTVTTTSPTKVGDTVLVTGIITTNKDFGAGYKYALIIQDAKVTVE